MSGKQFLREPYKHRSNSQDYWLATDSFDLWKKNKNSMFSSRDIVYKFNNYGFRCDDFNDYRLFSFRILFAGCSYTEGIGLPLDQCWPKIFHKHICEELDIKIPFWSIAAAASGTDHVLRNLNYFYELLQPHILIMLVPYLERRERWMGDYFNAISPETKEYRNNNKIILSEKYVNYQTEKNFVMMDLILESINSKGYLISLEKDFSINHMNLKSIQKLDMNIDYFRNRFDLARDQMHPGPLSNMKLATSLSEVLTDKIKESFNANRI